MWIKTNQKEVTREQKKETFLYVTQRLKLKHITIKFHGTHKISQKFHQREVTQRLKKEEQSFLHATHPLNLIHIAVKFHQDISYGNQILVRIRPVKKLINGK